MFFTVVDVCHLYLYFRFSSKYHSLDMDVTAAVTDGDAVDEIEKRILKIAEWKVFGNLSVEKVIIKGK